MNQTQPIKDMLCFQGQWRVYQKRVLDRADRYLEDKRVHIVAAPGSGKTTLGIELIRRLNQPALILSPSINIRNQWIARMKEAYLPADMDTEGILSYSVKDPGIITAITYQALHSGVNDPDFDFFATIQERGIKTLCLDEAHHLRSEWWKALEELVKREPELTIISLTATPPYDATESEWDRYVSLCGPIDEEIIVPELVKEKSLCPHQDYVYFNMPTKKEKEEVLRFRKDAWNISREIFENPEFTNIVSKHVGINNPAMYTEQLLEKPEYLSAILVFLNEKGLPFSKELKKMLGAKGKIPNMSLKWMERLLQGFLYEDIDSYPCDPVFREQMVDLLKGHGLIQKKKVCLVSNENINKLLRMSKGKINSMVTIVGEEYKNLGENLRLLILTDYIKKEYMSALGVPEKTVNELGVVPIFENIRREYQKKGLDRELRLAALSGSVVIIPETAKTVLEEILVEKDVKATITECNVIGYYQVSVSGSEETASNLLTELFYRGEIRVLIGTKSLLGEGWDSPCINSLILASFVGSFMLSNQMRGRAIRIMKENPDKVSNIWHLVCMEPPRTDPNGRIIYPEDSEDFDTLKRRFEGFLGVNYKENIIENGWERLSFIEPPYNRNNIEKINKKMLEMAADRDLLRKRWNESLEEMEQMEVVIETTADKEHLKKGVVVINALAITIVSGILSMMDFVISMGIIGAKNNTGEVGFLVLMLIPAVLEIIFVVVFMKHIIHLISIASPLGYMKSIAKGVLHGLKQIGAIQSERVEVGVKDELGIACAAYLKGGTEREKDVFAQTMYEMLVMVDNQRYILKANAKVNRLCRYYCVPELFGKRKEDAELFAQGMKRYIGSYQLCYTRSKEGRKELLKARMYAFANLNERCANKKKKVKSAYE